MSVAKYAELHRVCLATHLVALTVPCVHSFTWHCPHAADMIEYLTEVHRRNRSIPGEERIVGEIENILPWLRDRRKGPADRRRR